jgi:hypothetical protein
MPAVLEIVPPLQEKPHPNSYDSGDEHSLDHWLEVYWLVEEDYIFAKNTDPEPHTVESRPHQRAAKSEHPARSAGPHRR